MYTIGDAKINCTQEVLLESKRLDYVATCQNMAPKKLCLKNLIAFLKTLDSFHYLSPGILESMLTKEEISIYNFSINIFRFEFIS